MIDKLTGPKDPTEKVLVHASTPGWDVRLMRLFIVGALVTTAIHVLDKLLEREILEANKLEVGLLLGWLIAKSGTVIDWLFGGSESGGRRADLNAHQAAQAPPIAPATSVPADAKEAADQVARAAEEEAATIGGKPEWPPEKGDGS